MKKLFSLLYLLPVFAFAQPISNINFKNHILDSSRCIFISPVIYSHFNVNEIGNKIIDSSPLIYGLNLKANLSNKLNISARILKVKGNFNSSLSNYIDSLQVFPGMSKVEDNKLTYLSYKFSYKINQYFTGVFGKGKHFIGHGYRSMLLSNNHSPYPYFSMLTQFWKVKYYNLFTTFSDIYSANITQKKHGAFHYLDYQPTERLRIGVFEGIIWQAKDDNYNRGYDLHYLNPIIFYRPVEFSKHSPDNALMGLDLSYTLNKSTAYCQFLLDDINLTRHDNTTNGFFQNKYAVQVGVKTYFEIDNHNVKILAEYNKAQPYTYAHKHPLQNYTHMNQSLAHPLGANLKEKVLIINHKYENWGTKLKYTNAVYGADTSNTHYGQNIFISDFLAQGDGGEYSYGNYNGQGVSTNLQTLYAEINYDLKAAKIFLALYLRKKSTEKIESNYLVLGIKTDFINPFLDF